MPIHLLIKLQGFKNLGTTEFTMTAEPSDTITAIATKLEKITGIYADKVSVMTGLIHGNPSGSFKKLDKNATVSDNGLRHGSTLMVFIPVVGQQQASSSPDIPIPPPVQAAPRRRTFCVGKATYMSSPSEPIKSGDIMAVTEDIGGIKKSKTTLLFEGIEYTNAQEWLKQAFNNSGKSQACMVQIERPQTVVGTPRPTRYVPPSATCKFGRYM
jgi:hypothetical protein